MRRHALSTALVLAQMTPDDSSLQVALSVTEADDSAFGPGAPDPEGDPTSLRLRALVDLARDGDSEAFGQLYDHYASGIYRFVHYRVGSPQLAEDLTSETFVRGLRAIQRFSWQGKDFGAWLTTIARNLITDHFKSSRSRLELVSDTIPENRTANGAEDEVMSLVSHEMLFDAVRALPPLQRDCVLMRFVQGLSIAQTAAVLERSEGAVKQLQLRAVRALASMVPGDAR